MRLKQLSCSLLTDKGPRRRGVLAVELVLVLPLLLILLLAMMEFSLLLTARQELLAASREGARVASHGGMNREAIEKEVRASVHRVLGNGRLGDADVHIHWVKEDPRKPNDGRDRVEVVVHVQATHVVPNLLAWAGFNLGSRELAAGTVMNVE